MRLQGQKQAGVKIAIQPYPYIKGESKGKNKSLVILDATTEDVHKFIVKCFQELEDENEQFTIWAGDGDSFNTLAHGNPSLAPIYREVVLSKSIVDSISQELLDELQEVQETNPRLVELIITMVSAIGETVAQVESLTKATAKLEMSREDHDWKLNTLKDITVRNLYDTDPIAAATADKKPTIHQQFNLQYLTT